MKYVKLNDVCEINIGKTPSRSQSKYWEEGSNFWLSISDMKSKYLNSSKEKITNLAIEECNMKPVLSGTIIMSFKLSIGKVGIVENDLYTNEAIASFPIRDLKTILPSYLYYALIMLDYDSVTDKAVKGKTLNKAKLKELMIPLPSIEVQQKIANTLDLASDLVAKRKKQLTEMDRLVQSVFYEMFGHPLKNEKNFEIASLSDLAQKNKNAIKAGPFGSALKKEFYVKSGYKIYGQEQVIRNDPQYGDYYISEEKYNELINYSITEDDVLISLVGTFGKMMIVPKKYEEGIINPRLMKISLDNKKINPIFFVKYFQTSEVLNAVNGLSHGGTMGIINTKIMKDYKMICPPVDLQQKFEADISEIELQKKLMQQSLTEMENNFNALMQKAFRGELFPE